MFVSATVVVGATATKLVGAGVLITGGQKVLIKNTHATDKLIVGGANVAANNGFGIDAGAVLDLGNLDAGDVVYAIRGASADINAQVLVKG
jgi:hypothetical protein